MNSVFKLLKISTLQPLHFNFMTKHFKYFIYVLLVVILQSCSVIDTKSNQQLDSNKSWALLPFQNHTTTPRTAERIESIVSTLLYKHGIHQLTTYPRANDDSGFPVLDDRQIQQRAFDWAKQNQIQYAVTGSVEEWRYKSGVGGEPVVGLNIRIIEINTGHTVWSATGSRSGWSSQSLTGTTQKLIRELLSSVDFSKNQ